jgi:hypothetical protein
MAADARSSSVDLSETTDLKDPVLKNLSDHPSDREERATAELLTRFRNLVTFAAMPAGDGATKEVAASHAFQMEVESIALVCIVWRMSSKWC